MYDCLVLQLSELHRDKSWNELSLNQNQKHQNMTCLGYAVYPKKHARGLRFV